MENQMIIQEMVHIMDSYRNDRNLEFNDLKFNIHIDRIRIKINNLIITKYPNISMGELDNSYNEKHYCVAYLLFMRPYIAEIVENITRLDNIPNVEQRTPEWFSIRNEVLSASSISKVLGTEKAKGELILEKIGVKKDFISSAPTTHGTIFEEVSQSLYETRHGVKISEYGCIPHESISFIGASPDGAVHDIEGIDMYNINYDTLSIDNIPSYITVNTIALFGNLLEIKNPYSRQITNNIKFEYQKQITTQQEVCKLYKCDFVETNYTFYDSQTLFLEHKFEFDIPNIRHFTLSEQNNYVKNHNIPLTNISSDGVEKGILLKFKHKDKYTFKGDLFNLKTVYDKEGIDKWITDKTAFYLTINYELDTTYYWKVNNYSLKECNFNNTDWIDIRSNATVLWERIIRERLLSDKEVSDQYKKLQAIEGNLSTKKRVNTNYEPRNLEKKPRNNPHQQPTQYNF